MSAHDKSRQGQYFVSHASPDNEIPLWDELKPHLPIPVLDSYPVALDAYWKAWEMGLRSMRRPISGSGFVSPFLYMDFNHAVYAHDTGSMLRFANYAHRAFKAVESLDNFYVKQHETGEICREIDIETGKDNWPNRHADPMLVVVGDPWETAATTHDTAKHYFWTRPTIKTHPPASCAVDGLNDPPCMALAELHYYRLSGDLDRLKRILPVQAKFYEAIQTYLQGENKLYITDWASMDNSPRNVYLGYALDVTCQQAYFARLLATISDICGEDGSSYRDKADELLSAVENLMWDDSSNFYYCLDREENPIPVRTVNGFLPLIAGLVRRERLEALKALLSDPTAFGTPHRVPSLAADEPLYTPDGEYYHGGVWTWLNQMVITGLEQNGESALAGEIAREHWRHSVEVYRQTGTFWEYFAPSGSSPGKGHNPEDPGKNARSDFAGWGATAPVSYLLEYAIGLRPDAGDNCLTWNITDLGRHGCMNYHLGKTTIDFICAARKSNEDEPELSIRTDFPFELTVNWGANRSRTMTIPGGGTGVDAK